MFSSNHHLSLYTKLITVVNKTKLVKHEIKTMRHHSQFYGMIRMGVASYVRGNRTEIDE